MPPSAKLKALEVIDLCDRAAEEKDRIATDIKSTVNHYLKLHTSLSSAAVAEQNIAERARVLRKLFKVEQLMPELWHVAEKHEISELPLMPKFAIQLIQPVIGDGSEPTIQANLLDYDSDAAGSDEE